MIVGGESGPLARPMRPDWARSLRDQCQAAAVAFFFKQWGEWAPYEIVPGGDLGGDCRRGNAIIMSRTGEPNDGHYRASRDVWMGRVGKKAAGRLLDGVEWSEFPEVSR
jgi:protein gp37